MPDSRLFVLDHDFPTNVMALLPWPDHIRIAGLRNLHPDLVKDHDDWEVLRELRLRGGVDAFITLDSRMLNLAKEMVVLCQSRLSMIVFEDVDNDPLVATGLLMIHLPYISRQLVPRKAQLWIIRRSPSKSPLNPWNEGVEKVAVREGITAKELYERERLRPNPFLVGS
ncbi:MAG: hypothetical protein WEB52_15040 [Dehalococcoidia bacterium]